MNISNKFKYIHLKVLGIFFILLVIGTSVQYHFYSSEHKLIKEHANEIVEIESLFFITYLTEIYNVLDSYKKEMNQWPHFDKTKYTNIAQNIIRHYSNIQAVNFVNNHFVIQNIFPEQTNRAALGKDLKNHSDSNVKYLFQKGISKTEATFLPPVYIYQGGSAIIFYLPVHFQNQQYGWLNIVIKTQDMFSQFFVHHQKVKNHFLKYGLFDLHTKREYYKIGDIKLEKTKSDYVYMDVLFLHRTLTFIISYQKPIADLKHNYIVHWSLLSLTLAFLCYLIWKFLLIQKNSFMKYINTRDESNLLKILIHDISGPLLIIKMNLERLHKEEKYDQKLVDTTLANTDSLVGIIKTLRSMLEYKLDDQVEQISVADIISELLAENSPLLKERDIKVEPHLQSKIISLSISRPILKSHIINNLLINSIKFAPKGSTLRVIYNNKKLSILNHSDPIEQSVLDNLNSFNIATSTKGLHNVKGLGLGLFIAKIFCNRYNLSFHLIQHKKSHLIQTKISFK